MRVPAIIAAIAILSPLSLFAVTAARDGTSLLVHDGNRTVRVPDRFDKYPLFSTIHAVTKRNGEYFVVYGTSEWSRGYPPRGGYCGSGIETYISWIRIAADGSISNSQRGLYESCTTNRHGYVIGWHHGKLEWETTDLIEGNLQNQGAPHWQTISYLYDSLNPELGIAETKETKRANNRAHANPLPAPSP